MKLRPVLLVMSFVVPLAFASVARADDEYALTWSTLDGGGGVLSGDDFLLAATVGQPDAVPLLAADGFELRGGFWIREGFGGRQRCIVDLNRDGFLDGFDFDGFVEAFELGSPVADINRDGFIDGFDYDEYIVLFERGC